MTLENPTQRRQEKLSLTPEMIEALGKGYELEVEHLREENISNLEKADGIDSLEKKKAIITHLGDISVRAAKANEELLEELRKRNKLN